MTRGDPAASGRTGRADWDAAAASVLAKRGILPGSEHGDVRELLQRRTVENIPIPAVGFAMDLPESPLVPAGVPSGVWDIRSRICDPDPRRAAGQAIQELGGGATSLWLVVGAGGTAPDDIPTVLADVRSDAAPIAAQTVGAITDQDTARSIARALTAGGRPPHPDTTLGLDPIGRSIAADRLLEPDLRPLLRDISPVAGDLGVRLITVDGCVAHHRGAGEAGTLGYAVAAGLAYLRALEDLGCDLAQSLRWIEFRLPATDDLPATIAMFRAARLLWGRVADLSGAAQDDQGARVHAVTSWPMMTRRDPYTNLLRTTVAAVAAGLGGADVLTVLPFDQPVGRPEPLGRRLARTISLVLQQESHVMASTDPAAGAYALERLTVDIADAAWAEASRIDAAGGIGAAVADGSARVRWSLAAAERNRRILDGTAPVTGVSSYPDAAELPLVRVPAPDDPFASVTRWAEGLETTAAAAPVEAR